MAFQLSPGVQVTERDLTSVIPAVGTSIGGTAGNFVWGPTNEVITISSENELVSRFGKPPITGVTYRTWFAAASFLAYTGALKVVRAIDTSTALNSGSTAGVLIQNEDDYINNHFDGSGSNGMWAAKYPGAIGNSLKVSFADSSDFAAKTLTGTATAAVDSDTVTGSGTAFDTELKVGQVLEDSDGATIGTVSAIASATSLTLEANAAVAVSGEAITRNACVSGTADL